MDKLLARAAYTRLHAARKAARSVALKNRLKLSQHITEHTRYQKSIGTDRRKARTSRRCPSSPANCSTP